MRREGVIRSEIAVVDQSLVSPVQTFVICLSLRDENSEGLRSFCAKVQDLQEVQQCYLTTGDANCVLVALLPNAEALRAFVGEHFTDDPFVYRFRTHLVTEPVKVGLSVPIE